MTRLEAALAELAAALRDELRAELEAERAPRLDRLLSVDQAAVALGLGRSLTYQEISSGRLASVRVGRRRLVPSSAVAEYVATRASGAVR